MPIPAISSIRESQAVATKRGKGIYARDRWPRRLLASIWPSSGKIDRIQLVSRLCTVNAVLLGNVRLTGDVGYYYYLLLDILIDRGMSTHSKVCKGPPKAPKK